MNYKIEGALKKNKTNLVVFVILWIVIAIVFVSPLAYSIYVSSANGSGDANLLIETFGNSMMHPFQTFIKIFAEGAFTIYLKTLMIVTIFYSVFFFIGFVRSAPKNEFTDIEHGSSDWSKGGEQYQILNKNKGIVLAENNYLPVDKRGNVNVLVVGRFWFW